MNDKDCLVCQKLAGIPPIRGWKLVYTCPAHRIFTNYLVFTKDSLDLSKGGQKKLLELK